MPVYLRVTLSEYRCVDNTSRKYDVEYKQDNNLLRKLTSSSWGDNATTLRTLALAVCFSATEHACPVWGFSAHANKVDTVLRESCRFITGCLEPTDTTIHTCWNCTAMHLKSSRKQKKEKKITSHLIIAILCSHTDS